MTAWLKSKLHKVKFVRTTYQWFMGQRSWSRPRKLIDAVFVFLLKVIYLLLLTPYAIICRRLLGRSPLYSKGGWNPHPQTTADISLLNRMV